MDYDATSIIVESGAGPFKITAPNSSGNVTDTALTVTWDVTNTTAAPVSCPNVDILLSTDGGTTFPTTLAKDTLNDGTEAITLPSTTATGVRIKVLCSNNIFFDISNANFCINGDNIDPIGFECGIPSGWTMTAGANAGWELSTAEKKNGSQSLKSSAITDNQTASISITKTFLTGTMTFYLKTGTEATFDFFKLFVDNVEKLSISGPNDWTQQSVALTAGQHTIRWDYIKDFEFTTSPDAVWIDDVVLPILKAPGAPTALSAAISSTSASISFTAPTSNGGSDITSYTATCGSLSTSGISSPLVVSGLTLGTTYSCTVTATNATGTGAAGTVSVTTSSGLEEFVKRFYQQVLQRTATTAEVNGWVDLLQRGTKAGADIAFGFIFSQEFINRDLNNSDYLDVLYRSFFGREPDSGGKSAWTTQLTGGVDRQTVLEGFTGSPEFATLSQSFGINAQQTPVQKFVTRFYQQMLQREPDATGLTGWVTDLNNKTKTGSDIANGFVFSQEFINRNLSDRDFVTILYRAFFGREPDTSIDTWVALLGGGTSRQDVLNGFLGAQEFINLAASFGISAT